MLLAQKLLSLSRNAFWSNIGVVIKVCYCLCKVIGFPCENNMEIVKRCYASSAL